MRAGEARVNQLGIIVKKEYRVSILVEVDKIKNSL
jgi:hypothetical protein